ncbi:GNAT family N-acetyltransferase [Candidatus Microthrix parvicella]|uniref:GNAT family N-acetyltransferase n=1 Tax=Candidatus Neomicrothrix parvicella TaxID=41950 RepID=UPI00036CC735|nr:GNAT family N-acetyltransferase [Candidatus Microthrix parvicella]
MGPITRTEERTDSGLRVSYPAIAWDQPEQAAGVTADLRELANDGGEIQWWIEAPPEVVERVAAKAGWVRLRTLVQLRRPLPMEAPPPIPGLRTFDPDRDVDAWLELNNQAFSWHPEQGHQNHAGMAATLTAAWVDLDGFFVVDAAQFEAATIQDGTRPPNTTHALAGFCWTKFHPATSATDASGADVALGEVYVIATASSARGRGLGQALVQAGMDHQYRVRGAEQAMLWTESDNTRALKLYERLGYTVHHTNVAYGPGAGS